MAGHRIEWTLWRGGGTRAVIICDEDDTAMCKMECPAGCEEWTADHAESYVFFDGQEKHRLRPVGYDAGECSATLSMEDPEECYDGEDTEIRNGAIEVRYMGEYYVWAYAEPATIEVDRSDFGLALYFAEKAEPNHYVIKRLQKQLEEKEERDG